jgi:hypothetical protein
MLSPQEALEKIVEDLSPLVQQYEKTISFLKDAYAKTPGIRKAFLEMGIEYTKSQPTDETREKEIEEELSQKYQEYKEVLDERVQCAKSLLFSVTGALAGVDRALAQLDAPFDPKFGIQTQNPRIYRTNKKNPLRSVPGEESPGGDGTHCICRGPAHGDMIACDSFHAEGPWFHMECVDCAATPKGHWFCPKCTSKE